ncbi:Uncharacterised protein [Sebaldella termitidis]|uniref:DUF6273 domain-containing protein n=1 Tax=Sebaldella termitidis (strain ATCC 33386 / NCTC 11300) TaxID=526218 RepID=D1AN01_SEBTE|nr:DUF6273 domain-containing protein [Sebaldella termitidis]ACZ07377.1 hypothetical protein Sterm_0502 [Sebaldella termitidis ATCC 33386]SUI22672.1 Uncharacterised protein [Sebaldella termitidis]
MQAGDKILFGNYEWRVLEVQNNTALIITEYIIEQRAYHNAYKDITWADCSLRKYLNSEFYDRFTAAEKSRIIPVLNKNPDNQWYGTKGGTDTQDSIFLLSIEETVCRYFGDSSSKLYSPGKNQRYWFERKDKNNSKRIARLEKRKEGSWWWWLRSPGRVSIKAVYIHGDGNIGIQGNNILKGNISDGECKGGLRPALWLKF